jgi:hypothetical protein
MTLKENFFILKIEFINYQKNIMTNMSSSKHLHDKIRDLLSENSKLKDNNKISDNLELTINDKLLWKNAYFKLEKIIKDIRRLSHSDTVDNLCDCIEYIELPEEPPLEDDEYIEVSSSEEEDDDDPSEGVTPKGEKDILLNANPSHCLTDMDIDRYKIYDILSDEFISNPGFINVVYLYLNVVKEFKTLNNIDNVSDEDFIIKNMNDKCCGRECCVICGNSISHYITNHAYLVTFCSTSES